MLLTLFIFVCMGEIASAIASVSTPSLKSRERPHYIPEEGNGICYEYYQKPGGEWYVNGNTYNNRIVLNGRMSCAACDSEYVVLTNDENLSFNEVAKSIYSNNSKNWLEPRKAVVVEIR